MKINTVVKFLLLIAATAAISMLQSWHEKKHAAAKNAESTMPGRDSFDKLKAIPVSAPAPKPSKFVTESSSQKPTDDGK